MPIAGTASDARDSDVPYSIYVVDATEATGEDAESSNEDEQLPRAFYGIKKDEADAEDLPQITNDVLISFKTRNLTHHKHMTPNRSWYAAVDNSIFQIRRPGE